MNALDSYVSSTATTAGSIIYIIFTLYGTIVIVVYVDRRGTILSSLTMEDP